MISLALPFIRMLRPLDTANTIIWAGTAFRSVESKREKDGAGLSRVRATDFDARTWNRCESKFSITPNL